MPHIHTDDGQHDLTVTAYIVRTDTPEPKALFHMHRKLHALLPVGGHVELDETPWQAIAHEIKEESGYVFTDLKILQPSVRLHTIRNVNQHPYPLSINTHAVPENHYHTDLQYGFVAQGEPTTLVEEGESVDLRWLTQKEMNETEPGLIFMSTIDVYNFMFDEVVGKWDEVSVTEFTQSTEL